MESTSSSVNTGGINISQLGLCDLHSRLTIIPQDFRNATSYIGFFPQVWNQQLVVLARALVKKSTLIILNEATPSVDFDTEYKVQ
ncbi:hypothetical protein BDC45DRAFT_566567 [Circinella umbellata]|nr:hypothetical protein BDC45DRAFT_566567 [Circinella umbellata]